jgi:hypothetical protein
LASLKKKASPMSMVGFPLLLIPLAIYNIIALLMRDVSFVEPLLNVTLVSGTEWSVTLSDILLALGVLLLLLEVLKGARPGAKYLTDHLLSLIVFGGAAAEFLLLPRFGTSTYFLLTMLALVDFLSGIALRARRGTGAPATAARPAGRKFETAPERRFDPESAPSGRAAASERADHPESKTIPADVAPAASASDAESGGLQSGEASPASPQATPR